jgi:hypothetical protein
MYQNSFGKSFRCNHVSFLCNHENVPVQPWNLVRLYVAFRRMFPLFHFATMPEPEPRPVICSTLTHLFRLRLNLENILAISLPSSRTLAGYMFRFRPLVPAQFHLGEHSFYAPSLVPRPIPSLSARLHDRSKRHMTCWQSLLSRASSLQFNWNAHSF